MSDTLLGTSVAFHFGKRRKKVSETVRILGPRCSQFAKTQESSSRKVADPIADLRRAVAAFRPGQERLAASSGAEVRRTTEPRRGSGRRRRDRCRCDSPRRCGGPGPSKRKRQCRRRAGRGGTAGGRCSASPRS